MTNMQRAKKILAGLLLLLCSGLMVYDPENGLYIVALILSGSLILYGVRCLSLYIFMARHMVGGKAILYRGIIILDLGVFTLSMVDDPKLYIIFYLLGFHAFAGVLDILRALDLRTRGVQLIACPTCGRTCIPVEQIDRRVEAEL